MASRPRLGTFARRVLVLTSGATLVQLVPVLIAPILTRIYSPDDFGVYAIFMAIIGLTSVVACARYELAIVVAEKDDKAIEVTALAIVICLAFSAVLLVLCAPAMIVMQQFPAVAPLSGWVFLVPPVTFAAGVSQALVYFNIHLHEYGSVAKANAFRSLSAAVVQIGVGLVWRGPAGLLLGTLTSFVVSTSRLSRPALAALRTKSVSWADLRSASRAYSAFPRLSLPGAAANATAWGAVTIGMGAAFSAATLGQYALVQRVLGAPTQLIGASIGQVYFRQAMSDRVDTGTARPLYDRTAVHLLAISTVPFVIVLLAGEALFPLIFGPEWALAGKLAVALTPLFWAQFMSAPLSNTANVYERQGIALLWQLGLLALCLSLTAWALLSSVEILTFAWVLSLTLASYYSVVIVGYRFLGPKEEPHESSDRR